MKNTKSKCKYQKLHRKAYWLKPERSKPDIRPVEECGRDNINRISEKAAEHKAPECCGDTTVHEHLHELLHSGFHVLEFGKAVRGTCHHDKTVSRVREHEPELYIVEQCHYHGRVNLALGRNAVALNNALHRFCELIVVEQDGHILLVARFCVLYNHLILFLKQLFKLWSRVLRYVSGYKEYAS